MNSFSLPLFGRWRIVTFVDTGEACNFAFISGDCDGGDFSWWGLQIAQLFVLVERGPSEPFAVAA